MAQYLLKIFEDKKHSKFRVIDRDGDPWFVLSEVCRELGISNPSDWVARLDEDEKGVAEIETPGGVQNLRIINESGLYSIILRSTKPEAKTFKKWITSEVLPAIRKTGRYGGKMLEMLREHGVDFDAYPSFFKHGTFVRRRSVTRELNADELVRIPEKHRPVGPVQRSETVPVECEDFLASQGREAFIFGD
jgi:prophage antirepressor-like protein